MDLEQVDRPRVEHIRMRPCLHQYIQNTGKNFWPWVKSDIITLQETKELLFSNSMLWNNNRKLAAAGFAVMERAFKEHGWIVTIDAKTMRIAEPEPIIEDSIKARSVQIQKIISP